MENFIGKVVLITGSSGGIGEAIALHFAKLGANIVITGRNRDNVRLVAKNCGSVLHNGSKILEIIADLTNDDEIRNLIDSTVSEFGRIDVLVNNAAIRGLTNMTLDTTSLMRTYDQLMRTNLRSIVVLTHLAVPHLEKTNGNIVNISSIGSLKPIANRFVYCMAKSALDMFTKCIAIELGPKRVRVNSVNAGLVVTKIANYAIGQLPDAYTERDLNNYKEAVKNQTPLRVVGEPRDVANTVAFLACDAASFITGAILVQDGGFIL